MNIRIPKFNHSSTHAPRPTSHVSRLTSHLLLLLALALPLSARAAQQILRMEATVTQSEIFLGEAAFFTLQVHGYQPHLGQPDLSALPADIQLLGQQDQTQQRIQIINGVRQVASFSGRTFTYRVLPHEAGIFQFTPITLTGPDGKPLPVNETALRVRPIPEQDHVTLWVTAPTNHIIVDEPFDVSLFVRIRKLPRPYQEHSPIPNGSAPHLQLPYLDLHPQEGLRSENLTQLLQRMLANDGETFRINDHVVGRDPFGGIFGRDQAARFRLPRKTDPHKGDYYLYELKSRWSAEQQGDFVFGPVRFRGSVITNVSPQGQPTQETIYAIGAPVTVTVRNPPADGRPATFLGASGAAFQIQTSLDTQICQRGDPVTLTVDITGDGPAHRIRSPRPETLAPLQTNFRTQPEPIRSESIPGGRRFTYLIRPKHAGTLEIPALEIAYFDLVSRAYRRASSDPLPIRVNPGEELEPEAVTGLDRGRIRIAISAAPGDLPPAPFSLAPTTPAPLLRPSAHVPAALIGPLLLLISLLAKWLPRHIPRLQARIRQKQAYTNAMETLDQPHGTDNPAAILRNYLTITLGAAFAKGDPNAIQHTLAEQGLDQQTTDAIVHILMHKAYTGQTDDTSATRIQQLIQAVAQRRKAKTRKTPITKSAALHTILLVLVGSLACSALADNVAQFEQRRTYLLLLQARETTDFLLAADALADQLDQGERHHAVLYNLGTALLMAEQPALALPILQRAERRGATAWNVRRNMLLARRMLSQDPARQLPWIRKLLFWHYQLHLSMRITLATLLFALVWILVTLRWIWKRNARGILPAMLLCACLGASIIASLYAELQNEQDWPIHRRQIRTILQIQQGDTP